MKDPHTPAVFGKRKEPHTVIIAQGDRIRHFTVRPWVAAFAGSVFAAVMIGYLLATSYLVLRDDLLGAASARQARLQQAYEDRISALRSQVDRITSRQLLDQQLMEGKVAELLDRQTKLSERTKRLGPLLERAGATAPLLPAEAPAPIRKPELRASALPRPVAGAVAALRGARLAPEDRGVSDADHADQLFVTINRSLRDIETDQLSRIKSLTENTYATADQIADALEGAGLKVDIDYGDKAVGGPLIAVDGSTLFETQVSELDEALTMLDRMKAEVGKLPIANPAPGKSVSSGFGVRKDPIIGRPAMHAGIDFRATTGTAARATASGTVVKAGWNGGYGRMVEIDHGNGLTTRYAHLSAIKVAKGAKVRAGDVIGKVGSSGRSTGPHLHYEIRRDGAALNPLKFLKVGAKVKALL